MHVVCVRGERCSKAHTAFSSILMECQAQEECISALPNHARDEHEWDGGRCDFHPLWVCTCEQCENKAVIKCVGMPYQTKMKLSCPFHALAYENECKERDSGHNFCRPSYCLHPTHVLYYTYMYILSAELIFSQLCWLAKISAFPPDPFHFPTTVTCN